MDSKLSAAGQFFEQCKDATDKVAYLGKLVIDNQAENDWLDFKRQARDDENLKSIWFKALSGFANTEGGVIVWGIEAVKNADGIDAASALIPVDKPNQLESRLRELARNGTNPPVQRVSYLTFNDPSQVDKGYVLCFIPESNYKPHRAETKDQKQYYFRVGDSFQVPSPAILRQLFYPLIQPFFEIEGELVYKLIDDNNTFGRFQMTCRLSLRNIGTASAHNCLLEIIPDQSYGVQVDRYDPRWKLLDESNSRFMLRSNETIHPQLEIQVCNVNWFAAGNKIYGQGEPRGIPRIDKCDFEFAVYSRDSQPQRIRLQFDMRFLRTSQQYTNAKGATISDFED